MTTLPTLQLGKSPVKRDPLGRTLQFSKYRIKAALPTPPAIIGHSTLVKQWGMCANDRYGDCVFAGSAHQALLFNAEAGRTLTFTDTNVLSDYAAVTGFDPKTGANDNGTNMLDALNYLVKTGVVDSKGVRHKLGGYVELKKGDFTQLEEALYLFTNVLIGIKFPASAMVQFNAGQPWDVVKGSKIEGGHCVLVTRKNGRYFVVTWGREIEMTAAFYKKYCDEAYGGLSPEMLNGDGKSLDGFDLAALQADLTALKHG